MGKQTPQVAADWLEDPSMPGMEIRLDSSAWFVWLAAEATTRFSYPVFDPQRGYVVGVLTVRKERRQRGGAYWAAYRRQGSQLRKFYIGLSPAVTRARLEAIAAQVLAEASLVTGDA